MQLVHSTFNSYAENVFLPMIDRELLRSTDRVDIVWDRIIHMNKIKRGSGTRFKVGSQTKIPSKWKYFFLLNSSNKSELFAYLTEVVRHHQWLDAKPVFITNDDRVVAKPTGQHIPTCTHKEADTRIVIHIFHALAEGVKTIQVRTVNTDILVILISEFNEM